MNTQIFNNILKEIYNDVTDGLSDHELKIYKKKMKFKEELEKIKAEALHTESMTEYIKREVKDENNS